MYLQGDGIKIGGLHDPPEVPPGLPVRYVEELQSHGFLSSLALAGNPRENASM